jgi:hypothetical protein
VKRLFIATLAVIPLVLASIAAAAQGREATSVTQASPSKITICHKTGSASTPWRRITVSSRAMTNPKSSSGKLLRAHMRHTGDAIVVGAAACPTPTATPATTSTPATKITICHKTGSATTPYRRITVSSRAVTNPNSPAGKTLRGHMGHTGDLLLPGANACPAGTQNQGIKLTATLTPVQGATGSGSASLRIRLGAGSLCYTLTVSGLVNVTAAHIHRGSTAAIVVPLSAPTAGTASGCVTVEKGLLREIVGNPGGFYVNVHTMTFPNGQVQGALAR